MPPGSTLPEPTPCAGGCGMSACRRSHRVVSATDSDPVALLRRTLKKLREEAPDPDRLTGMILDRLCAEGLIPVSDRAADLDAAAVTAPVAVALKPRR